MQIVWKRLSWRDGYPWCQWIWFPILLLACSMGSKRRWIPPHIRGEEPFFSPPVNTHFYIHPQYGSPDNSSRPGGIMTQANFISSTTNTTFHLLADNSTVTSLISSISTNCSSSLSSSSSSSPSPYNDSNPASPQPESAIQYYRASSVVLTLDGYNDTAADSPNPDTPDTPLPTNIDITLLNCLNSTIGQAVPLVDGALVSRPGTGMGVLCLFWVVWVVLGNEI